MIAAHFESYAFDRPRFHPSIKKMDKLFLLGVGAQKAGTTWLHEALVKSAPNFQEGFCKEYHVFDGLSTNPLKRLDLAKKISHHCSQNNSFKNQRINKGLFLKGLFFEDVNYYFDYFDFLSYRNPEKTLFCDITPSYSSLNSKQFVFIKHGLESRGFAVKSIFIVRDPLERAWSASKYYYSRRKEMYGEDSNFEDHLNYFLQHFNQQKYLMRGRYDNTINACITAFGDSFKCLFFEELFTKETTKELAYFLKIDNFTPNTQGKINKNIYQSKDSAYTILPKSLINDFLHIYSPVYQYMEENYKDKVEDLWQNYYAFKS